MTTETIQLCSVSPDELLAALRPFAASLGLKQELVLLCHNDQFIRVESAFDLDEPSDMCCWMWSNELSGAALAEVLAEAAARGYIPKCDYLICW